MLSVRAMTEADVAAVSAIRVNGWKTAYGGILPRSYLDAMTVAADTRRRLQLFRQPKARAVDLVSVDTLGRVVGWACLGPLRGAGAGVGGGELYALYVEPSLVGHGIGRVLLDSVHAHARALGFDRLLLWVLEDNSNARRFYERADYAADGGSRSEDYDGVSMPEVRYRTTLRAGRPRPEPHGPSPY